MHRLFLTGLLAFGAVVVVQSGACARAGFLSEYFKPQSALKYAEVYHYNSTSMFRASVGFDSLMSIERADDYVRFKQGGAAARDLYEALNQTVILNEPCKSSMDMRWAVVLTYEDQSKEAVGFGKFYECVEILSTGDRIVASTELFHFVLRTFPFMR